MEVNVKFAWKSENKRNNSPLLPNNIRGLIVGKSNSGKTCLVLNLLLNPGWLDYDHLYIFGKSLHQKEYVVLKKGIEAGLSKEQLANLFHNQESISSPTQLIDDYISNGGVGKGGITAEFFDDCQLIPDPSLLNDQHKNLMIFDDCILERQNKCQSFYTRGRHSNCDSFYISQNYFKLDRQTIRENSNLIILFPQNPKNLQHIHADHCNELAFQDFKDFCNLVWSEPFNFVTLDLSNVERKYRQNLDRLFDPKTMAFKDDKMVQEYTEMVKRIQERDEKEKTTNFREQKDLMKTFAPIIQATEKQTKDLLAVKPSPPDIDMLDFYLHRFTPAKVDRLYGIREEDGQLMMGYRDVEVKNNNIYVEGTEFIGTTELWALVMLKNPDMSQISPEALREYRHLVDMTLAEDFARDNYTGRDHKMLKKYILLTEGGKGISFLPSDLKSLKSRLNLLLAEFNAGNRATRNEIVAIVDNLAGRRKLTKAEARDIAHYVDDKT